MALRYRIPLSDPNMINPQLNQRGEEPLPQRLARRIFRILAKHFRPRGIATCAVNLHQVVPHAFHHLIKHRFHPFMRCHHIAMLSSDHYFNDVQIGADR